MTTKTRSTHTPGPWYEMTRGRNEYQSAICQEATGNTIALTYTSNDADARLIAAAPEMKGQLVTGIEALREALREAAKGDYTMVHAILSGVIAGNELAIAQAEGGQP